jgi:hypothetical protein
VPNPLMSFLGCVLRVVVLLEGEPSPVWGPEHSGAGFHQGPLYFAPFICSSIRTSFPIPAPEKTLPQHNAATTMLHRRDSAWFHPDVMLCIQAKELNVGFIRPGKKILFLLVFESFRRLLALGAF